MHNNAHHPIVVPIVFREISQGSATEDTPHGRELTAAVMRAVDALEGQGARSNRIALQLLEALCRYEESLSAWSGPDEVSMEELGDEVPE